MFIDMHEGGTPKRGDLLQTNVGSRRERTWMILTVRRMASRNHPRRYMLWAARWWELEVDMRVRLFRSAERNGGQRVIWFKRYPARKKLRDDFFDWPV